MEIPAVDDGAGRVRAALEASGIAFEMMRHERVDSLEEAAAARGVSPNALLKTLVVRRGDGDFLFVLVPGDRQISWPKLRALLGVSRLSMPDARVAFDVTGYVRGTITPFGSTTSWPVICDSRAAEQGGPVSLGGGEPGVGIRVDVADLITALAAQVADVTEGA